MTFGQEIKSNTLTLRISGDLLGEEKDSKLFESINEAVSHKVLVCVIDISDVRYINSSGIGLLITILTKFRNKSGEVFLMNPSDTVKKLLVITKLNAIFQIVKSEEEVTNYLKKNLN